MTDEAKPPTATAYAVSLSVPDFWPSDPELWFAQAVTSHLATRKTRHQQTRHQYEISYYIKSKPNMIFSEA